MSQLNLKQVLSGDDLSVVVDKLNYNFNQILLNGGGPQGLQGIMGAPGLPGAQGIQGLTGPMGETGTHIYVDGATPGIYPFGTGGEMLPRVGDIFIETDPTFLNLYQLSPTGSTGSYWNLVETITTPGNSLSKLVLDQVLGASATWKNASNDPAIAGKLLIGSPDALYGSYIIDPAFPISSASPTLRSELSSIVPYGNSLATFASNQNQLRLIDYTRNDTTRLQDGGGIAHSVETITGNQYYRIINADIQGSNRFYLSLNSGVGISPSLIYGDTLNRIGFGVADGTSLVANTTTNGSLAVGNLSSSFYLASAGATFSNGIGAIIEGNLSVGRNSNLWSTLGVYNRTGSFGSSLLVDTTQGNTPASISSLTIAGGFYDTATGAAPNFNQWRFNANYDTTVTNTSYRTLKLFTTQFFGGGYQSKNAMTFGLTGLTGVTATQILIDEPTTVSTDLFGKFEIGDENYNKISIGNAQGVIGSGFMSNFVGFNLSRSPIFGGWRRGGDGTGNAGKAIWSSTVGGLGFSFFGSTGGATATSTDAGVYGATKIYLGLSGGISTSDYTNAYTLDSFGVPLHFAYAATGTTGQGATSGGVFRRYVATFGDGVASGKNGSPMIASTNGITQSISSGVPVATGVTAQVLPHYTWWGSELYGLYLSAGTTANGASGESVGIAVGGSAGITLTGKYNSERRLGLYQERPLARLHIGDLLTYNDVGVNIGSGPGSGPILSPASMRHLGYNTYVDIAGGQVRRIAGSTATGATQQGAFDLRFLDNPIIDPFVPLASQGLTGYSSMGTKLALVPHGPGSTFSTVTNPAAGASAYRGVIISPPATGPTAGGWINYSANTPRVSIGLDDSTITSERDSPTSLRRGTLSIAAQTRIKPATAAVPAAGPFGLTIEDQYNIGLYSYDALPIAGIYVQGGNNATTVKTLGLNFLGTGGNAIADDIPLLFASTSKALTQTFSRVANFGAGFRLGVNIVPAGQPQVYSSNTDPTFDFSSLVVGAYTEGLTGSALDHPTAIISKGILVVDQSTYGDGSGANQGIYFKDNSINYTGLGARDNVNAYYGDWGIQYWKPGGTESGLNFWKPAGQLGTWSGNSALYISDNGFVGIKTYSPQQVGATMSSFNVVGQAYISGNVGIGTGTLTYGAAGVQYAGNVGGGQYGNAAGSWPVNWSSGSQQMKVAVNGGLGCQFIATSSDLRLKEDVIEVSSPLQRILQTRPVFFVWKEDEAKIPQGGFIAQEIEKVIPESIRIFQDEEFEDGRYSLDYNTILAVSVGAIQELHKEIEEKDKKIQDLEARLKLIEEKLGL